MEDDGRPPGMDPRAAGSWVDKVQSSNGGGVSVPEKILGDEFVKSRMRLEFPNGEGGEPVITIGMEVLEAMNGLYKQCMVVKVLGRHLTVAALNRKLQELWKPRGNMFVLDLPKQFFMIRFDLEEDYMAAVTGGPWRVFGSIMLVQAWSPDFDPMTDEIATTPVWVRIANIPVNFYHRAILMGIAEGLGRPIKVDLTTMKVERARFARVCVEVDLKKPLKGSVVVNGVRYYVAYEGLSNICSLCGLHGHTVGGCPTRNAGQIVPVQSQESNGNQRRGVQDAEGFTEVRRKGRNAEVYVPKIVFGAGGSGRKQVEQQGTSSPGVTTNALGVSNRFLGLEGEVENLRTEDGLVVMEEDKENVNTMNGGKIVRGGIKGKEDGVTGKQIAVSGKGNVGEGEKRSNGLKAGRNLGARGKYVKASAPTRGLVFGPIGVEDTRISPGKRLRVEQGSVGRAGGAYRVDSSKPMDEGSNLQVNNVVEIPDVANTAGSMVGMGSTVPEDQRDQNGDRAGRICQRLGLENSFRVDATGQSGGLWLLWKSSVGQVEIVVSSNQFIHARIVNGEELINLVVVYAAPSVSRRSGLWGDLRDIIQGMEGPLVIGGDFNTIVRVDERTGGSGRLSPDSLSFGEWINDLLLIDMGFKGGKYTWKRGRVESTFVAKRLDRVLCCASARLKWQEAVVSHLPFLSSDHAPLYVQLSPPQDLDPRRRPFRFEAAWLKHEGFKELLTASWDPNISTPEALNRLRGRLKKWNREVFGDVHSRKEKLITEIKEVQDLLEVSQSDDLLTKEEQLLKDFDTLLEQEEVIWYQKSREKIIALGDRNTTFFHTSTIIRRRRNRIELLKDVDDRWVSDKGELENLALNYYRKLYSLEDVNMGGECLPQTGFTPLTRDEKVALDKPFGAAEVVEAVKKMGSFKAPGPDGFQPVFYQKSWDIVGTSVIRFVLDFFESGVLPQLTNAALLVLLPKVARPEKITQFRPVSLCNVLFKVITKMMVIRLKSVISKLIGPAQASFIPGRLGIDNIVVVQEAVHSMRRKKGRKGWMLLKLDLEKAYDRIRWDFLRETLEAAGLSEGWCSRILECVADPSMSLLWNGEKTASFQPERGLRQGDPLSPYLFVLCLERLCHLIEAAVGNGQWKPISLSRGGPKLSHVCFADDLILFAEASVAQVKVIRRVLERFCLASGQKVSLEKSKIFFSSNVSRDMERAISAESGISSTRELGKYLGMPILQKRINKTTYGEVLEKVSSRLAGWKNKTLSMAGRITLTKAVLSSIPVYSMSSILLPASTLDGLDKLARSFVWGSTVEKRKQHLLAWDKVCKLKKDGGLGLKEARTMNKALLAKVGWRLMNDKESLWARVVRMKYKVGEAHDLSWMVPKSNWSSTWRSVGVGLREVVSRGIGWVPGDGKTIRFWTDRWVLGEPLRERVIAQLPEEEIGKRVEAYWTVGIGWDTAALSQYLSVSDLQRLNAVVVKGVPFLADQLSWQETTNGVFSVRSAYALLKQENEQVPCMERFFKQVWAVKAPERVRVFIWLVTHQVIMTNMERMRRHIGESAICQVCKGAEESIIHVLRDCPAMAGIWVRFIPQRERQAFFNKSLLEWLFTNLNGGKMFGFENWATLFSMAIWWGWKWRCGNIFGERRKCRDRVRFLQDVTTEVMAAHTQLGVDLGRNMGSLSGPRVARLVSWKKPGDGWVKLNTDGASRGNPGQATAGGVIRDGDGHWRGGFSLHIGICSAPMAELWGIYYGLVIAWERGYRRVELEVDSELVVGFVQSGVSDGHPLSFLVRLCQGFFSRDWLVRVTHVYREANRLADGLANYAFTLGLGFLHLDDCPDVVHPILLADANGTAFPRHVRM
ncbi:Ribonuclease H domain [Arabidopsis thaliana x Arabidopsis arenosa]|uniref:Ribonuclease H domain n=1 Tax=Arabidopsis thaliana x Arabidopsis arenosa TaxID=1240361 RepID=A0A8T2ASZ2_9BRAS|nr:Ribonuclease H domain [Arabidopsis thaliana x Arabidopsis arenosa]